MATWQFWTLVGVVTFLGANIWALLSMTLKEIEGIHRRTMGIEQQTEALTAIQAVIRNDIEDIKFRAQRD